MSNFEIVSTKEELKKAIKAGRENIVITDPKLANSVRIVKTSSKLALGAALTGAGVAAVNWWNPVGWGAAAFTAAGSSTLIISIVALGLGGTLAWALYNGYDTEIGSTYTHTDKDGNKHEVSGKVILKKKG